MYGVSSTFWRGPRFDMYPGQLSLFIKPAKAGKFGRKHLFLGYFAGNIWELALGSCSITLMGSRLAVPTLSTALRLNTDGHNWHQLISVIGGYIVVVHHCLYEVGTLGVKAWDDWEVHAQGPPLDLFQAQCLVKRSFTWG